MSAKKWNFLKMCHLRCRLKFFYFIGKLCYILKIFKFFVFLTIPWFTKYVTSWWMLVDETGCIFEFMFWTKTHKVTKLDQTINTWKGNNFKEPSEQFGRLALFKFQVLFNLATYSNYSLTNYVKIPVFYFFEKVNKGQLKMVNVHS